MTLEELENEYKELRKKYNEREALTLLQIYYSNENISGYLRSISSALDCIWEHGIQIHKNDE